MAYLLKKYSLSILLSFLMLVMFSCHKGGEPVPYKKGESCVSTSDNSNLRIGDVDPGDINGPDNRETSGDGGDEDEGPTGDTIIGGDDNEDDDDDDNDRGDGHGNGSGATSGNGGG